MAKKQHQFGSATELNEQSFDPNKIYQFWLIKKNQDTSYASDKSGKQMKRNLYPISYPIKLEFETNMYNPESKRVERTHIRHCAGEHEIIKWKQTPDDKVKKTVTRLLMLDGHIDVRGTEDGILKCLALHDGNMSKKDRDKSVTPFFFLRDDEAMMSKVVEADDARFEAELFVRSPENFTLVCAYARLILDDNQYEKQSVNPLMLRQTMLGLARKNPVKFMTEINNPILVKKHYMLEARDAGIIIHNEATNAIYFKSGELICQAPIGTSPINLFVDKIGTDKTRVSEQTYQTILEKLGVAEKKKAELVANIEPKANDTEEVVDVKELLKVGELRGVVVGFGKAGGFYWCKGTPEERTFMGYKKLIDALDTEPAFKEQFFNMLKN